MSIIDKSKPIWRVRGRMKAPDLRRCTTFVNAANETEAIASARAEWASGLEEEIEEARLIPPETIIEWEKLVTTQ